MSAVSRIVAASLLLPAAMLPAQSTSSVPQAESTLPAHTSSIVVQARLVVLDVVVTDKSGKPVDGLTENDFQVFEDGQMQRIRSLEPPTVHTLPETTIAAGADAVFDPARPASFGHSPVTVLVLDQLNTHFADSSFARRALHDYLVKQPAVLAQPATLLSEYDNHFKLLQGFTLDRDLLLKTLATVPTKYAWELETTGGAEHGPIDRLDQSLRALEEIAQSYAAIPGRKNLVWVGGGFPSLDPQTLDDNLAEVVRNTMQHVTDVLLNTRVTIYAVDPSSNAAGMTEITDLSQQAFADAAGETMTRAAGPFDASEDFDNLGPVTGGRVVHGRNDIAALIGSSVDLGASSYTLSYTPNSTSDVGSKFRKIRVICLRPGLTVATRTGYYPGRAQQESSEAAAAYDLTTAAEGPLPLNGLQVSVVHDLSVNAGPNSYIVHVGAPGLTWKPKEDGGSTSSVYILAVSFNAKTVMLGHTLQGMLANAKPGVDLRDPARIADFAFAVTPAPKATGLRFIVRDSTTGRMGSVDVALKKH